MSIPPFDTDDSELEEQFPTPSEPEGTSYEEEPEEPKSDGNKSFKTAIAIIGGIALLFIVADVLFLIFGRGLLSGGTTSKAAQINAQNTAIAMQGTATEIANQQVATMKALPTNTKVPTNTPVVAPTNTATAQPTLPVNAQTQTVVAFQTMAAVTLTAQSTLGLTPQPTSTGIPDTGIMDDLGLPFLAGGALALVAIIILARKLRLSSHQ